MFDVIIPLRNKGSAFFDYELKYALRSIERNLIGYRYIWVVGAMLPPNINDNIRFIQHADKYKRKQENINDAILTVCNMAESADNLIFWADDNMLIKPLDAEMIPVVCTNDTLFPTDSDTSWWARTRRETGTLLKSRGYSAVNYEAHTPTVFNKDRYIALNNTFDFHDTVDGLCYISMYHNVYGSNADVVQNAVKATWVTSNTDIKDKLFVGYANKGAANGIFSLCQSLFPAISSYEKPVLASMSTNKTIGVVLGAYKIPQLVDLQLYYLCMINKVPVLVHDDISDNSQAIRKVVDSYKRSGCDVEYFCTDKRLGHRRGDLSAFTEGLLWAQKRKLNTLVKVSQHWVVQKEWLSDVLQLMSSTSAITLSGFSDFARNGKKEDIKFRTECFAVNTGVWLTVIDKLQQLTLPSNATLTKRLVEPVMNDIGTALAAEYGTAVFMDKLLAQYHETHRQDCFVHLPILGENRVKPPDGVLWHHAFEDNKGIEAYKKAFNEIKLKKGENKMACGCKNKQELTQSVNAVHDAAVMVTDVADYTKLPTEHCVMCAEKHFATAFVLATSEIGYRPSNAGSIVDELVCAVWHMATINRPLAAEIANIKRMEMARAETPIDTWLSIASRINDDVNAIFAIEDGTYDVETLYKLIGELVCCGWHLHKAGDNELAHKVRIIRHKLQHRITPSKDDWEAVMLGINDALKAEQSAEIANDPVVVEQATNVTDSTN